MSQATLLLVALAGGAGAASRFVLDGLVNRHVRASVPLGTVVVNVLGSFLLGLLVGLSEDHVASAEVLAVLGTGFLGGFTTFSTASLEAVRLAAEEREGAAVRAVVHAVGMLALGLGAAALGLWLG